MHYAITGLSRRPGEGDGKSVIDRFLELLAAPDVSFGGLYSSVREKKLN
jgi:hypothetical protein